MTINPTHYRNTYMPPLPDVPPNSPQQLRYIPDAEESDSDELYPDIDKAEGQGNTKPIPIPTQNTANKNVTQNNVTQTWNNSYWGD